MPELHASLKASRLAKVKLTDPAWLTAEGIEIEILERGIVTIAGNDLLRVVVSASYRGRPVPVDNPYLWANPPAVHNGDADPLEVLRAIVSDAVELIARRRGWRR
jgi:hypothetical protein